ncbi:hypothetical protein LNN31_16340 [Acetobacterium wieringae]|uniref:Uncharacterized protein n=1 Tax=Acetobacterium wieringae TaxID=52694 RepID=A0ABY6HCX2_9FIRM|nr:hypothetical protein [Acetobacterium wieringae]UYO62339.1 hypothetical protein LNN31_16340 [Acetobacterium wieringae]VUZ23010.1 Uncharacterised protein [Acetobacterium wieringae]
MNSENLIKGKLTNLAREYQKKIDAEIKVIEQKRQAQPTGTGFFDKLKATGNAALEKGQTELVKRNYPNVLVVPDISDQLLLNAAKQFELEIDSKLIIGMIDTSLLRNGTKGYFFTGEKIYVIDNDGKTIIKMTEISDVMMTEVDLNQGKEDAEPNFQAAIRVTFKNNNEVILKTAPLEPVFSILKSLNTATLVFEESDQRVKQEDLSDLGKVYFIKVSINYLMADDGMIDSAEYASLISLISMFVLEKAQLDELRDYRLNNPQLQNTKLLLIKLMKEVPIGSREAISLNLLDSLLTLRKESIDNWKEDQALNEIKDCLKISNEKVAFLVNNLKNEIRIEKERLSDDKVAEIVSSTLATGSAIGIPFAALAATGAITGFGGASGGLFALAFASTGGMIVGITAIGAASFGAYKGIKYLTGSKTAEKYLYRQAKLQSALVSQRKATNMLLQDINWLSEGLETIMVLKNQVIDKNTNLQAQYDQLRNFVEKLQRVSNAAKVTEQRRVNDERELLLTKLPELLDLQKLELLLKKSVDWEKEGGFILTIYQEVNGEYVINTNLKVEDYEIGLEILERLGYFKTASDLESTARKGLQKLREQVGM